MQQQKGKKILIYFLRFLIVGSISNNSLNRVQLEKIKNIKISSSKALELTTVKKILKFLKI